QKRTRIWPYQAIRIQEHAHKQNTRSSQQRDHQQAGSHSRPSQILPHSARRGATPRHFSCQEDEPTPPSDRVCSVERTNPLFTESSERSRSANAFPNAHATIFGSSY